MIADIMEGQRPHHVPPSALFQHARLLADDLERGAHAQTGQVARDAQRGIVGSRLDVVLRIKPQRHVYRSASTQAGGD